MNNQKLKEVLSIQSESYNQFRMFAYLIRQAKKMGANYTVIDGNIYIVKGYADVYPCVVAHMDTVHEIRENFVVIKVGNNYTAFDPAFMEQTGIGGDDKVGIFLALQCLEKFDNIKVAFFRDEEVGCEGSYLANKEFFNDCAFVLQGDRRGNDDFVTNASGTELSSKYFQQDVLPILERHGYKFTSGMMTDVMALKEVGIPVSMANVSCGYYNPHSSDEFVSIADVANCLEMFEEIIESMGNTMYDHKVKRKSKYEVKAKTTFEWEMYNKVSKRDAPVIELCDICRESVPVDDITYMPSYNLYGCPKCKKYDDEVLTIPSKKFAPYNKKGLEMW